MAASRFALGIVVAFCLVSSIFQAAPPADKQFAGTSAEGGSPLTISRATTYITEPLRPDGCPDYVAAMNRLLSRDVTPENNVAVLILKARGPGEHCHNMLEKDRKNYFQMLGIAPLPQKGDYFVDLSEYAKSRPDGRKLLDAPPGDESLWGQYHVVCTRPWSKREFPIFAGWLAANEGPLATIIKVSKRLRSFDPIVPLQNMSQLLYMPHYCNPVPFGSWLPYYDSGRTLRIRALARLRDGQADAAWEDILACHRLARLGGQGPTIDDALPMYVLEETASFADRLLLQRTTPSARQLAKMRADLAGLAPLPKWADKFNVGERLSCLSWAVKSKCEGFDSLKQSLAKVARVGRGDRRNAAQTAMKLIDENTTIDWNVVLRTINLSFDRRVDAIRSPTRKERATAVYKVSGDLLARLMPPKDRASRSRQAYSEQIGIAFVFAYALDNTPTSAQDRAAMRFEVTKLAFALAQFHADRAAYPAKLAELTPAYVAQIPRDVFNNADLHYTREGDGYLLYSVGVNGEDNGGKEPPQSWGGSQNEDGSWTYHDDKGNVFKEDPHNWDDIVMRMPGPVEP